MIPRSAASHAPAPRLKIVLNTPQAGAEFPEAGAGLWPEGARGGQALTAGANEALSGEHTEMKIPGPDHPITIEPSRHRVVVRFAGAVVADTRRALELKESSYRPVLYVPRDDAKLAHFERSDRRTHCPYKGDASYFHLRAGGDYAENVVWSYETPFPAMAAIEGFLAFYPDKVAIADA